MAHSVTLTTFFRPDGSADPTVGPEKYVAGFEDEDGEPWGAAVPLEPDDVEAAVFRGVAFSVSMEANGILLIEAEGRGDAMNEAIAASGGLARPPLDVVVRNALEPTLLVLDDDGVAELRTLRRRLETAIQMVDEALGSVARRG